jgi:aminoglycoside phosphotransferase (APT) family kinase protein
LAWLKRADVLVDGDSILRLMDEAPDPPESAGATVAHGDLHAGQLLADDSGHLTGVIDWGDMHRGHRAVDLAIVHQLLPRNLHDAFLSHYGPVDRTTWRLARARAAWHAVALLASAVDRGDVDLAAEARLALQFITSHFDVEDHGRD